jgi:hypothetical protein
MRAPFQVRGVDVVGLDAGALHQDARLAGLRLALDSQRDIRPANVPAMGMDWNRFVIVMLFCHSIKSFKYM